MLDEYVSGFQIPVDDWVLMEIFVTSDELFHDEEGFWLWEFLSFLEYVLEWSFIAELLEEIDVIGWLLYIKQLNNILVFYSLHDLDLVFQWIVKLLCIFFDIPCWYGFNCD